jgi:hypothetical protein
MSTPIELFRRWYAAPLRHVESLANGDGAFVALACSCFLYERYATAMIKETGGKADRSAKITQFESDFKIDNDTATHFWDVIRNGFLHQGMGMQLGSGSSFPEWSVSKDSPRIEFLAGSPGQLRIQPWLFRDRVIELWESRPDLLDANGSFPWATIW